MRKSLSTTLKLIILSGAAAYGTAGAQVLPDNGNNPIILPSTSSSYNQNGFNLPTIPNATGQDIVRGSGGISCQSSVGSGGPNFDLGVIGSNDMFDRDSMSVYGRITVPLGKRPKRVDCTRLYDLEISRLQMELQLMRAGASSNMLDSSAARQVISQGPAHAAPRQAAQPFHLANSPTTQSTITPQRRRASPPPQPPSRYVTRTRSSPQPHYSPIQTPSQPPRGTQPKSVPPHPNVKCCQTEGVPPHFRPTAGPAYQPYHNDARRVPPPQAVRPIRQTQNLLRR